MSAARSRRPPCVEPNPLRVGPPASAQLSCIARRPRKASDHLSRGPNGARTVGHDHRRMSIPRSRDLRLLAGAAGVSALGDFMAIFPLILHVQQRTSSALAVSALIFALWGPVVLAAGVAGAIVDRFENRRILIAVSLLQAATVTAMLAGLDSLWALLPLMTLLGFGVAVSQPAEFALIPAAAGPDTDAARANGLMETARSLGFTAGPLVGGALGAGGGPWAGRGPRPPPAAARCRRP